MKWLAVASLLLLAGCVIDPTLYWRDSAEDNCRQESMVSRQEACLSWVEQTFQDLQYGR